MVLVGRTRGRGRYTRYELCPIGYAWRRQPQIVAMDMAKRNDRLHRQRKQRQLRARSKSRSEPIHYFKAAVPILYRPIPVRRRPLIDPQTKQSKVSSLMRRLFDSQISVAL